jgi:hypothetical protein
MLAERGCAARKGNSAKWMSDNVEDVVAIAWGDAESCAILEGVVVSL